MRALLELLAGMYYYISTEDNNSTYRISTYRISTEVYYSTYTEYGNLLLHFYRRQKCIVPVCLK